MHPELELTDREMAIATMAAKMAVEDLSAQFYQQVGKTVVQKLLTWIGWLSFAFFTYAAGAGYLKIK